MGYAAAPARAATEAVKAGGRFRLGIAAPAKPMEPNLFADHGTLATGSICGEFLNMTNPNLTLAPMLATSWKPNAKGTVWTYTLRKGVKFANGQAMTAADVVATYKRLTSTRRAAAPGSRPYFDPPASRPWATTPSSSRSTHQRPASRT